MNSLDVHLPEAAQEEWEAQLRESIAANVEALGCNCTRLTSSKTEHRPWIRECPLSIAAAIREGRL